jgi:hypothetical protein
VAAAARSSARVRVLERVREPEPEPTLAQEQARETTPSTRTTETFRCSPRHCSRQVLARKRLRRQRGRSAWPPDRAARRLPMRRVARSLQVPAASRSLDLPRACRQRARRPLRQPLARARDGGRRRSRRVRVRTRRARPTTRARTARRASSSSERGCVANAGSRPTPWISRTWISGASSRSRSSSADPRTRPSSEPPVAPSPSDDQSNDTQNIPQARRTTAIGGLHHTPRLERPDRPGRRRRSGTWVVYEEVSQFATPGAGLVVRSRLAARSAATRRVDASLPCGRRIVSR